ncbi:MAG: gluconokinase [Actinomycetota bacterium]|nr:gluconokinase [Actinomycetota bacterium]
MSQQPITPGASPFHLVVMGVSGVGKTTVAKQLAVRLDYEFAEGDDFHPPANVAKMSAGTPLEDSDRLPWLRSLADWVGERHREGTSTVLTCSALRRRYRDVLREGADNTVFVHLVGDRALLLERMSGRQHFMPPALLTSQFDALEPLQADEAGVSVEVTEPPEELVEEVVSRLGLA